MSNYVDKFELDAEQILIRDSEAKSRLDTNVPLIQQNSANISTLRTEVNANTSEIAQVKSQANTNTSNISALGSRVDNIITSGTPTEGNTELIDIRTTFDGFAYPDAGQAVRDQAKYSYRSAKYLLEPLTAYATEANKLVSSQGQIITSNDWYIYKFKVKAGCKYRVITKYGYVAPNYVKVFQGTVTGIGDLYANDLMIDGHDVTADGKTSEIWINCALRHFTVSGKVYEGTVELQEVE